MTGIASSIVGTVSTQTLTGFDIINVSLPTANTEVPVTLPTGTLNFTFQNRTGGTLLLKKTSGGPVLTLFPGVPYTISNLTSVSSITLIFECNRSSQIVEIIVWS